MPSLLKSLTEVIKEDNTAISNKSGQFKSKQDERIRRFNLAQLYGMRNHCKNLMEDMEESVQKSAKKELLGKLQVEVDRREKILAAEMKRKKEEELRLLKEKQREESRVKGKELIRSMYSIQARFHAENAIKEEILEFKVKERSTQSARRKKATETRSYYWYASFLTLGGSLVGFIAIEGIVALVILVPGIILFLYLVIKGYLIGESWRPKVFTDKLREEMIETRKKELIPVMRENYLNQRECERIQYRKEKEYMKERRRKQEEEEERLKLKRDLEWAQDMEAFERGEDPEYERELEELRQEEEEEKRKKREEGKENNKKGKKREEERPEEDEDNEEKQKEKNKVGGGGQGTTANQKKLQEKQKKRSDSLSGGQNNETDDNGDINKRKQNDKGGAAERTTISPTSLV